MRYYVFTSLLFVGLLLTGVTRTAVAQTDYHPLEVGSTAGTEKAKPIKRTVWTVKPGAAAHLDPEKALFGWSIRPPRGFAATQKADQGNQVFIFQGDPRPDSTAPILWVINGPIRKDKSSKPQDEVLLDMYLIQLHENRTDWKSSSIEYGLIQGQKFIRRRWNALESHDGATHRVRGIVYLTLVKSGYTAVTVMDSDPSAKTSLDIMEASVFSLRKR